MAPADWKRGQPFIAKIPGVRVHWFINLAGLQGANDSKPPPHWGSSRLPHTPSAVR